MIKVRLIPGEAWYNIEHPPKFYLFSIYHYETLMDKFNATEPPFPDTESRRLLRECYDMEFVDNGDWYSVISEKEGRFSLWNLYNGLKYTLTLLNYSRRGLYLSFPEDTVDKKVWIWLMSLPFDILLAVNTDYIEDFYHQLLYNTEFLVENFPYKNSEIEVYAIPAIKADGYIRVDENLFQDRAGRYFMDAYDIYRSVLFDWKRDIARQIDFCRETKENPFEFISKYPTILAITKCPDGTYQLKNSITVKYPNYVEMVNSVFELCENETFGIVVDRESYLRNVKDLEHTVCGFHYNVVGDFFQIIDKDKALVMWADWLGLYLFSHIPL